MPGKVGITSTGRHPESSWSNGCMSGDFPLEKSKGGVARNRGMASRKRAGSRDSRYSQGAGDNSMLDDEQKWLAERLQELELKRREKAGKSDQP